MGSISLGKPNYIKIAFYDTKETLSCWRVELFAISQGRNETTSTSRIFPQIRMWDVLEATVDTTKNAISSWLAAPRTHRLAIEIGQWSNVPISKDNKSCHICSYEAVENEAHVLLDYPLSNPIKDEFPSLNEDVSSMKEPQILCAIGPTR